MKDKNNIEALQLLQTLAQQWEKTAQNRKETILQVLATIDDLTTDWLVVYDDGEERTFVYLEADSYEDDTFYNGYRQHTKVETPGVYRVDSRNFHEGDIVVVTDYMKPIPLRFTKHVMPQIVRNIERAIKKEIELTETAMQAESVLAEVLKVLHR